MPCGRSRCRWAAGPAPGLAGRLAAGVSRMTLLRLIRALPDPAAMVAPEVLGVDVSAVTLLRRGVVHVIDQALAWFEFYWLASLAVVVTRWPGRFLGR